MALFIDPKVRDTRPAEIALKSLADAGIETAVYDAIKLEPSDRSFMDAAAFATDAKVDGFISLGGGSTMDTAKAANLYSTHPADFLDYVNLPYGKFLPAPGPLRPHNRLPDHLGHRQRDHQHGGDGHRRSESEDGHLQQGDEADPGPGRPDNHRNHAVRRRRLDRIRRADPRHRKLHGTALHNAPEAGEPRQAARLPGRQSLQRRRQPGGDPPRRQIPRPGGQ